MNNDGVHEQTEATELPNRLTTLWHRLIDPGPNYQDSDERRRVKLLSAFIIIIIPVIVLLRIASTFIVTDEPSFWQGPNLFRAFWSIALPLISYLLNRTGYFRVAVTIFILAFIAAPFAGVTANPESNNIASGTLMVLGVFLASIFFSNVYISILVAILIVGLTSVIPLIDLTRSFEDIIALLVVNIILSLMIIIYSHYRNDLEHHRLAEFKNMNLKLKNSYNATLEGWSRALELKDKQTDGHSRRVTELSMELSKELGLNEVDLLNIRNGALLHDIGKMGIPDEILNKPGPLTPEERVIIEMHPIYAFDLLKEIEYLQPAISIPYSHHENWDGTGYPQGLQGEQIPLFARIFAVVDHWDALNSDRPYRKAWVREKVIKYLKEQSGNIFDPRVVAVFLKDVINNR